MKVAFLIATVHDIGGTAGAVVTQANALARRGVEVEILSIYPPESGTHFPLEAGVAVRNLVDDSLEPLRGRMALRLPDNADPSVDARADVALEAALPAIDADVLVTVTPGTLGYAVQLAPATTAIVHQEHRSSASRPNSRQLLLDVARRADVVAMLTEPMAHWLRVSLGRDCPEVVVVPNALAPGFRPRSPLTEPVVVAAGRLATEKQWPVLVRAFGTVADRIPAWRLRIFGEGYTRFEVQSAARKAGLWDRVELPGPTSDMRAEWARASISALTSQAGEGFPLVIQEAMAAGVPVVAFDMPTGPRDQITHGHDGLLVPQGSESGLAAGILRLASDADERRRMGDAALARAADWDGEAIAARWVEVFADAVRRRRTPRSERPAPEPLHPDRAPHGREGTGVTPEQARSEILRAATDLAGRTAGADGWFVVPPRPGRPATVVLPMAARTAYVEGLVGSLPSYVSVHDPEHRGWPSRRGTAEEMVAPLARARTPRLWLEPWPLVGSPDSPGGERNGLLGRGCAIAVDFWEESPDGRLHAGAGQAAWTTVVGPDAPRTRTTVHGVDVPTLAVMTTRSVAEVAFPIDVVYTWVDGSDPVWEQRRLARLAEVTDDPTTQTRAASGRARYVDRGELRWTMRSIHLFAPWVRTIHLVTDGQVPAWLDPSDPRIHLVDHRDLLPADALPTFSSHAIESVVHRIEGLAEHFVYFNDDIFLGGPTSPEQFFTPAGAPLVFTSSTVIGLPGEGALPWAIAADNNRRLLQEAFGVTTVNTMAHAPHAHRVSLLAEVAERFADAVDATTHAPFRSAVDVSMLSSLAQHYGLVTGRAQRGEADFAYVDITETGLRRRITDLLRRERGGFCLGDSHDFGRDPAQVDAMVTTFLEDYFPIPAPWER